MPEIDRELFQLLLLAIMGIAVLLLLVLVSTLSGIRKALKEQVKETRNLAESGALAAREAAEPPLLPSAPVEDRPPALQTPEPSHYGIDDSDDRPLLGGAAAPGAAHVASATSEPDVSPAPASYTPEEPAPSSAPAPWDRADEEESIAGRGVSEPEPTSTSEPAAAPSADPFAESPQPVETPPEQESRPAAAATSGTAGDPFASDAPGSQDVLAGTPGSSADDPFLTGEDENPFMRDADQPAPQSTLDEPEDQPFERNGRWFFKREGELLVYEEGTGEWVPADPAEAAPRQSPPSWSAPEATESPAAATGGAPSDTAELDAVEAAGEEPRPTAGGGFWKCPSCGAVNGSSAATCRMCFAARP